MAPTQFIRLSQQVGAILEAMGFPVIQAPGEAEATCAALCTAGLVDGVASFDGDTLIFGAEVVYPAVKLSATQEKTCCLTKCTLDAIRTHLGLTAPGSGKHALALFATLCGCDYDESGAQGIGGVGAMALIKKLLAGCTDDSDIVAKFENLLRSPPDPSVASIVKCTGCAQCKHEGGMAGKIKFHNSKNPCPCCPPGVNSHSNHGCIPQSGECQCLFHRKANDRLAERAAAKARAEPDLLQRVRDALSVYRHETEQAAAAVEHQILVRNLHPGEKLSWLHRPNVKDVHQAITSLQKNSGKTVNGAFDWTLSTLRSKMIPALLEWDLRHRNREIEFLPKLIKKIQGSGAAETQWRYLLDFDRAQDVDLEDFGTTLRPMKKTTTTTGVNGAADILLSSQFGDGGSDGDGEDDFLATQRPLDSAAGIDVGVFDGQWLASDSARNHRGVRISLIRQKWPELEAAFVAKQAGRGAGGARATPSSRRPSVTPITAREVHSPRKNLTKTPSRQRQAQAQPPSSLDRYLVQQHRRGTTTTRIDEEEEEEAILLVSPAVQKKQGTAGSRGVRSQGADRERDPPAAAEGRKKQQQRQQRQLEEEELLQEGQLESPSPLKRYRSSTPADATGGKINSTIDGTRRSVVPEPEGLTILRTLLTKKKERLAAEAARLEAMSDEARAERLDRLEKMRQRGREVGQLFAADGGGGGFSGGSGGNTQASAPAAAPTMATTEEQEEEDEDDDDNDVVDLVTPVSSSASEDEYEEKKEEPPPRRKNQRRQSRHEPDQQEDIVIDLTGDYSD
jgi:hypothetical protein